MTEKTDSALIDELGGTGAVAKALKQRQNAVSNWRIRGIPWRWRPQVAAIAAKRGVAIPDGFLDVPARGEAA